MVITLEERLMDVYHRLYQRYGPQHWWPGDGAFEVIIGAILTQSASWTNVDKALDNLKAQSLMEPAALRAIPLEELASLIRPSVYFNAKALKIKAFVEYLGERYNDDLEALFQRDVHVTFARSFSPFTESARRLRTTSCCTPPASPYL